MLGLAGVLEVDFLVCFLCTVVFSVTVVTVLLICDDFVSDLLLAFPLSDFLADLSFTISPID